MAKEKVSYALAHDPVAPGLWWARMYWVQGEMPKHSRRRNDVSDAPTAGWSSAFVIDKDPTSRRATVFCPHSFQTHQVNRDSMEWHSMRPMVPSSDTWLQEYVSRQWRTFARCNLPVDYDMAASVLGMLGAQVPTDARSVESANRVSGGKEVASNLKRGVKKGSRRGQVLAFYLDQVRTVREGFAEIGISRSNLLSQLFVLQKDHGIGYRLQGDNVHITLPEGCDNPWID